MKKEEIYTPTNIGLDSSDCLEHNWEKEFTSNLQQAASFQKWRCKRCLCTRYTYY